MPSRTVSTPLRRRRFAPDAATATVAMDPVKLDEIRNKRKTELMAVKLGEIRNMSKAELRLELEELKADLKKLKEDRSLRGAKVTEGASNKLSEFQKYVTEVSKKQKAALREAYKNREPLILCLRPNCQHDPSTCTAASPPGQEQWVVKRISEISLSEDEDGEGKEA